MGQLAGIAAGLEDSVVGDSVGPDVALTRLHHLKEGQSLQVARVKLSSCKSLSDQISYSAKTEQCHLPKQQAEACKQSEPKYYSSNGVHSYESIPELACSGSDGQ